MRCFGFADPARARARVRLAVVLVALGVLALVPAGSRAAPPTGYYDTVVTSTPLLLRTTLHEVIDDNLKIPYTSSSTDTWNVLELADQDPNNSANILDIYRNRSYLKFGGGTGPYNREHSWPNSYGFPDDGATNYPYTDCHHLFLTDVGYNSDRGNKPYGACAPGSTERVTDYNDGMGGGSGVFPGNSNWFNATLWQTWNGRQGDVARAMFYMDVRYEGGTHSITGAAEPNLILTDNTSLIVTTSSNASVAYMGLLSVLLQWNAADPVDDRERYRNDVVYGFQGNRNPFIDHPEWVNAIFLPSTGPTISSITDVPADQGGQLLVNWQRNTLDAAGSLVPITQYVIQRFTSTWVDVATQPANGSATYALTIPTSDIASPSTPEPWSQYRIEAVETGGLVHLSPTVSAYSIDNLPPPTPVVSLDQSGTPWVISWVTPAIPDFNAACVYRGDVTGFTPSTPLQCGTGTSWLEYDTTLHYYVVQFSDIHGNLSAFSAEVSPDVTDVPDAGARPTAITRIYPNPFNPLTRVAFSLGTPGPVRIDLFAADGRFMRTLLDESRGAGAFEVVWDGTDGRGGRLASGSYFLRLQSNGRVDTRKLLLLK
ncbi:MAG: endonuclease [Candidatus Krumholzibacteriia bacterium]